MPKTTVRISPSAKSNQREITLLQPMSNSDVEDYIKALFNQSTKGERATACTVEWLDFVQSFNRHQDYYVLNEEEMQEIEALCTANEDLEMTPDEFIRLIYTVRDIPEDSIDAYSIQDNTTAYFQDRESTNHPDIQQSTPHHMTSFQLKESQQENKQLLHKYQKQLDHLNSMSERISLLESRLENAKLESSQQKSVIDGYKNKEKERQETVAHLKLLINDYEAHHDQDQFQLSQKDNELQKLQEQLEQVRVSHQATISCLEVAERDLYQIKERMRQQEKDRLEQVDQNKQYDSEIQHLQQENSRLLGVIDKQKFDLDEARTAHYAIDTKKDYEQQRQTLENKLSEAQKQLQLDQQIQNDLRQKIATLSNQFDRQHELIQAIQKKLSFSVTTSGHTYRLFYMLSVLPWIFFLYHISINLIGVLYGHYKNDAIRTPIDIPLILLQRLDESMRGP